MKVDALLSAAPKGEVRRDVHFKHSHRWASIIDGRKEVLVPLFLLKVYVKWEFTHSLHITTSRERWSKSTKHLVPYTSDVKYKMCSEWRPRLSFSLIFPLRCVYLVCVTVWFWMCSCCLFSTVCSSSPRVKTRCSMMLWPSLTPSPGRRRRCPLCWLWAVFSCLFILWPSEVRNTKKCRRHELPC